MKLHSLRRSPLGIGDDLRVHVNAETRTVRKGLQFAEVVHRQAGMAKAVYLVNKFGRENKSRGMMELNFQPVDASLIIVYHSRKTTIPTFSFSKFKIIPLKFV
ncbi:hypothetical protein ACET3Z_030113 [Daucus carota]